MMLFADALPTTAPLWLVVLYPLVTSVVGLIVSYTAVMVRRDKAQAEKDRLEDLKISQAILASNQEVVKSNQVTQRIVTNTFDTTLKANEQVAIVGQGLEAIKTHLNIPVPDVPKPPTEEELLLKEIQDVIQQFNLKKTTAQRKTQHITVPPSTPPIATKTSY